MTTTRIEITQQRLNMYLDAERAVLLGQSYTIGNRSLTRASLSEIRKAISDLVEELDQLEGKPRGYSKRIIMMD